MPTNSQIEIWTSPESMGYFFALNRQLIANGCEPFVVVPDLEQLPGEIALRLKETDQAECN